MQAYLTELDKQLMGPELSEKVSGEASSLELLKVKLQEASGKAVAGSFVHSASGLRFDVLRMDLAGYYNTDPENVRQKMPDGGTITPAQVKNIEQINQENLCRAYLMNGIQLSDGTMMDFAMATQFAKTKGWGASNLGLMEEVDRHNPRYADRADMWTIILARQSWMAIAIDFYIDQNLLPELAKKLGETDDVVIAMAKFQDAFRSVMGVRDLAKKLDIDILTALKLKEAEVKSKLQT